MALESYGRAAVTLRCWLGLGLSCWLGLGLMNDRRWGGKGMLWDVDGMTTWPRHRHHRCCHRKCCGWLRNGHLGQRCQSRHHGHHELLVLGHEIGVPLSRLELVALQRLLKGRYLRGVLLVRLLDTSLEFGAHSQLYLHVDFLNRHGVLL